MNCQVVGKLFEIIKELSDSESSEINFLQEIDASTQGGGEINAVELANQMSVTRSAVTQMCNKLEERDLIEKYLKPDNKKEKYLRLTKAGNKALKDFEKEHMEANDRMCTYINSLGESERKTVIEFMDNLQQCMPISNFQCMGRRER